MNSMATKGCWAPPIEHGTYKPGHAPSGAYARLIGLLTKGKK
ncbi:hypothetical protein L3Y19_gp129 [Gordonia phage Neville]|uniref:Uncharacterized protein n=2 Tax=Nevillevirus TaxID=3044773 RepID=A0A515MHE8_9CAUD|nr:hypothetical protein L3Y19_gp129 [Gordonia phage Neville]YP_010246082.1 hypothetical protein L3Y20_gp128 [Gordonia phage Trax]AXQ64459.1 hypothetical protein SEA_NEVILLE_99 [Gordonia phage Neville]QDM55984.1 hypothetical protein SEA_TRAX_102 [Gordonia phage Trax]